MNRILLFFICLAVTNIYAQKTGSNVPNSLIPVHNYPKKFIRLQELKGKLVILDFWGSNCRGCIEAFPKLEALQKRFGDKIQIIMVTSQSKKGVDSVFARRKILANQYKIPDLPQITSDKLLHKIFPHIMIPHTGWISKEGKILAATEGRYVTEENIERILNKKPAYLPLKKDNMEYDGDKAVVPYLNNNSMNYLKYYSSIIRFVPGLNGGNIHIDSSDMTIRITRIPGPILRLYSEALGRSIECFGNPYEYGCFDYGKRVILEVKDSSRFFYDEKKYSSRESWEHSNYFGYELIMPADQKDRLYDYMLSDLNRFFSLNGRIEKRKMRCLSLVRTSDTDKLKFNKRRTEFIQYTDTNLVYHLEGSHIDVFRRTLAEQNKDKAFIIVNNTNYEKPVELHIQSRLNDLESLRKELREKYDLDLIEKTEEKEVMILTDNNYY